MDFCFCTDFSSSLRGCDACHKTAQNCRCSQINVPTFGLSYCILVVCCIWRESVLPLGADYAKGPTIACGCNCLGKNALQTSRPLSRSEIGAGLLRTTRTPLVRNQQTSACGDLHSLYPQKCRQLTSLAAFFF